MWWFFSAQHPLTTLHMRRYTLEAQDQEEAYSQESICDSVEIEDYSVAYFDCITVFEVPYC